MTHRRCSLHTPCRRTIRSPVRWGGRIRRGGDAPRGRGFAKRLRRNPSRRRQKRLRTSPPESTNITRLDLSEGWKNRSRSSWRARAAKAPPRASSPSAAPKPNRPRADSRDRRTSAWKTSRPRRSDCSGNAGRASVDRSETSRAPARGPSPAQISDARTMRSTCARRDDGGSRRRDEAARLHGGGGSAVTDAARVHAADGCRRRRRLTGGEPATAAVAVDPRRDVSFRRADARGRVAARHAAVVAARRPTRCGCTGRAAGTRAASCRGGSAGTRAAARRGRGSAAGTRAASRRGSAAGTGVAGA